MSEDRELRLKRLRMLAALRGLREAEMVLRPFAENHMADLSPGQLDAFELILNLSDLDLWEIISGRREPPEHLDRGLLERLKRPIVA